MMIQMVPATHKNQMPRPTGEPHENQDPQLRQLRMLSLYHSFSSSETVFKSLCLKLVRSDIVVFLTIDKAFSFIGRTIAPVADQAGVPE